MKEQILTNWTLVRAFYLIMGIAMIIQSVIGRIWFGVAIGGYFAAMGLFAFGCAAGSCFGGNCESEPKQKSQHTSGKEVNLEKVNAK